MKLPAFTRQDYLHIRNEVIFLGGSVLFFGVLLLATQIYLYFSEQEQLQISKQLQQVRASADAAQNAWDSVQKYQAEFNQLRQRSIFGAERRLDWIEAFDRNAKAYPQLQLQYTFAPQKVLEQSEPSNDLQVYASEMQLNYRASNEMIFSDVSQWLKGLPGYVAPVSCQLQLAEQAGIAVNCHYVWLTIAPVKTEVAP